ncbi:MAG TPA: hypothetical protein V6C58_24765 [Allocoleopsis sp.]
MAKPKLTLKESEVSQTIDLATLLGEGAAKNDTVRETFFQLAFDRLMERLSQGRGLDNKVLPKYSKAYKNSLAYAAFDKDGTVNMQLTGDMVNAIKIIDKTKSSIKVGINDENAPKAYNHQVGDTLPKREWFGWTDKELKSIANEIRPEINNDRLLSDEVVLRALDRLLNGQS